MLLMTLRTSCCTGDTLAYLIVSDGVAEGTSCSQHHLIGSIQQGAHIASATRHSGAELLPEETVCSQHLGPQHADDKAGHDGRQQCASDREVEEAQAKRSRDCHRHHHLQESKHFNITACKWRPAEEREPILCAS